MDAFWQAGFNGQPDEAADQRFGITVTEEAGERASAAAHEAMAVVYSTVPTTPAGFLAVFERFMERDHENIPEPLDGFVSHLLASARALFGPQDA